VKVEYARKKGNIVEEDMNRDVPEYGRPEESSSSEDERRDQRQATAPGTNLGEPADSTGLVGEAGSRDSTGLVGESEAIDTSGLAGSGAEEKTEHDA
jgi:hypothetical protein